MYKIYKITCLINGKVYIGYTSQTLKERFSQHVCTSNKTKGLCKMQRAILKHKKENFKIELVEECDTLEQAALQEEFWISNLNSYEEGYNSTTGGWNQKVSGKKNWHGRCRIKTLAAQKAWRESEAGVKFIEEARQRFLKTKPQQYVTKEGYKRGTEKYQKWLMGTPEGTEKRKRSATNMRKVQKIKHNGIFELIDPQGNTHIITIETGGIKQFCKDNNLSWCSFYHSLKYAKTAKKWSKSKNYGWTIVRWNEKPNNSLADHT